MNKRKRIAIIHHQPLEKFPPVQNFLNYISHRRDAQYEINTVTSGSDNAVKRFSNGVTQIKRIYTLRRNSSTLKNLRNFGIFTIQTLYYLLKWRPCSIFYYESHSALPVYLYFKIFGARPKLFIHYHEYMTREEYRQKGMRLVNHAHGKERNFLYNIASWISHTNSERMKLFLDDNSFIKPDICRVLPNYPPRSWSRNRRSAGNIFLPARFVYVGTFGSFEDLYIREVLAWAKAMKGTIILDIYSFNISNEVELFIKSLNAENIRVLQTVDYSELPAVLDQYDVGLILYKATSLNFKFNAPNKLFEYLAIGLDVWFSKDMLGCFPYVRKDVYPKVIDVDFNNLGSFDFKDAINRDLIPEKITDYFSEDVYSPLVDKLQEC